MKKNIENIALILLLFGGMYNAGAQSCFWDFNFTEVPGTGCCYSLSYEFNSSVCEQLTYTTITITTESPNTAIIVSMTPTLELYPFDATIVSGGATGTFVSPTPFNQVQGQLVPVGEICFAGAATGVVDYEVLMTGMSVPSGNSGSIDINCEMPPEPVNFNKYYGGPLRNFPEGVKAFDDGVYVIGANEDANGLPYATFSKFDIASGSLIWDLQLKEASRFQDFEYIPSEDAFLVVGRTEPSNTPGPQDNASLLVKILDNGTVEYIADVYQPGREGFQRIIRHPNPIDLGNAYYIIGTKNPPDNPDPPSATDVIYIYNVNAEGNLNWIREYDYAVDDEFHRGLFPLSNGNLVMLGNDSPANDGIIVEINGADGSFVNAVRLETGLDLYDGVELPDGSIAIAGHNFTADQGAVIVLSSIFSLQSYRSFKNIGIFRNIGLSSDGGIYVVGPAKNTAFTYQVVLKLNNLPVGLQVEFAKYLDNGESSFNNAHLSVTPQHDHIFYVDEREHTLLGFGETDNLVGVFDLNFNSGCTDTFTLIPDPDFNIFSHDIQVQDIEIPIGTWGLQLTEIPLEYECTNFCVNTDCKSDFTWVPGPGCFTILFTDISSPSDNIISWEWDFNGDDIIDATNQNPVWQFPFPPQVQEVCLTITTDYGCTVKNCKNIFLIDNIDVQISCPDNMTVATDPGVCTAFVDPMISAVDNCDPFPDISCVLTLATQGNEHVTDYNLGTTQVNCTATDDFGNSDQCAFTVTVEDIEPPDITCPGNVTETVSGCSAGANVLFNMATATDNCGIERISCDYMSGDFFPCGPTLVTCTAIDINGNSNSCSFQVNVTGCNNCAAPVSAVATCGSEPNCFEFILVAENLTTLEFGSATVVPAGSSGEVSMFDWDANTGTATGILCVAPPVPSELEIELSFEFPCTLGTIDCTVPFTMPTPCCEEVNIDHQMFCNQDFTAYITLDGCAELSNVQQVIWYYTYAEADGSCSTPPFGSPAWSQINSTSNACDDLLILPYLLTGDICVYAEVYFSTGPCQIITSNVAQVTFCGPIGCVISGAMDYCYSGSPINVSPLTVAANNLDCPSTFQWFDENGDLVPGATGATYQPGPLVHIPDSNGDCYTSYTFKVEITSLCDVETCSATINVFNADAPVGNLTLYYPTTDMPFCPGQDATLFYKGSCIGPGPQYEDTWNWYLSNVGNTGPWDLLDLSGGTISHYFNTNQLFQDTWYKVERTNGVCGIDETTFFVDLYEPTEIIEFTAQENDCEPSGVKMVVDFFTECPDGVTVDWYLNGEVVLSSPHLVSPDGYLHNSPQVAGNYFVTVTDNCCDEILKSQVVVIEKPWQVVVGGDCFRCNDGDAMLQGLFANLSDISNCTFQWYENINGNIVALQGENAVELTVDHAGIFVFEATCNGCTKRAVVDLIQCGNPTSTNDLMVDSAFDIFPNPFSNDFTISFDIPTAQDLSLALLDVHGRVMHTEKIPAGTSRWDIRPGELPAGVYLVRLMDEGGAAVWRKLVKD